MAETVRAARPDDLGALRELDVVAGGIFRSLGMDAIADDEPPSLHYLAGYVDAGRCWVAVDEPDALVGYVLVDVVDGAAHIEQVSVHPGAARRGIGRVLIDSVADWARRRGWRP